VGVGAGHGRAGSSRSGGAVGAESVREMEARAWRQTRSKSPGARTGRLTGPERDSRGSRPKKCPPSASLRSGTSWGPRERPILDSRSQFWRLKAARGAGRPGQAAEAS